MHDSLRMGVVNALGMFFGIIFFLAICFALWFFVLRNIDWASIAMNAIKNIFGG